jgi:hypothetical protein
MTVAKPSRIEDQERRMRTGREVGPIVVICFPGKAYLSVLGFDVEGDNNLEQGEKHPLTALQLFLMIMLESLSTEKSRFVQNPSWTCTTRSDAGNPKTRKLMVTVSCDRLQVNHLRIPSFKLSDWALLEVAGN